ncbi:cobaltochelatase CobT-related protein [Bradyrhizobium sp. AUGA SZCCT0182]|uniref:cobaltochelatase CobT-related protein n=1 Tax=Bradyrhizobium sp. AUGA SZCCT0182 TaxID=2807667 RepID=UPI001BA69C4B|nr:CobT protein [Bradyrhizobium sp. AUGA SZCCT0182]MBR1232217.1 CobT protein [Bradyrhizobium sp. AUGA SZCCT0182]
MALDEAWHAFQSDLLPWRTRLLVVAADVSARIRANLTNSDRSNTAVTLLVDQSGSMRGQKMLFAAATLDVAQELLVSLGFACEVLGFTTSEWTGGRSRNRWKWRFSRNNPGRLNDILHIVYKSADDLRASTGRADFRQMLRPDLPKENIDGEAVLWAARRLLALPQEKKHLIVLSDGAPVDDSTLQENGLSYLSDHLHEVVGQIKEAGRINLAALGLGHDASEYPVTSIVDAPDELGGALVSLLERILAGEHAMLGARSP